MKSRPAFRTQPSCVKLKSVAISCAIPAKLGFGLILFACVLAVLSAPARAQESGSPQNETGDTSTESEGEPAADTSATEDADSEELPTINVETDLPKPGEADTALPTAQSPASPTVTVAQPSQASADGGSGPAIAFTDENVVDAPFDERLANTPGALGTGTTGIDGYIATGTSTATKTNTPLQDIPQSITIVTEEQARDQGSESLGEALQYVPGITLRQGEGHRDAVSIRGQNTTADFYTDGVRDDIEYFRDLYNIETVEVLKGPNAMIFGRGGGGGIINRVTKKADWTDVREATINTGMYERKRAVIDVGQGVTDDFAVRLNAMYEDSENFRDFFELERYGINPKLAFQPDDNTKVSLSYEYYSDDRTVDRGVPSINGRPFIGPISTFYGAPDVSFTYFSGHVATATLEHRTDWGLNFRNHTHFGDYDKVYQNIFAAGAVTAGTVELDGYQNTTLRQSIFNQTDVSYRLEQSPYIRHTLLAGTEVGYQETDDFRFQPSFDAPGSGINTINVPVANPTTFRSVFFDRLQRSRHTELGLAGFYLQDQLEITDYFEIIGGIRFDRFDLDFRNVVTGERLGRVDEVWSPRLGVVFKPFEALSLYASTSRSFLPSAGDQFNVLNVTSATLEPEEFENREIGFKFEAAPRLYFTGALYKLDRSNQVVSAGPFTGTQVGLTRTEGGELGLAGYVTDDWQVSLGYGQQDAEVVVGAPGDVGRTVPNVPLHTFVLWNKYQFTRMWAAGIGIVHQSDFFAELNNAVVIPDYTRIDAALFFDLNEHWRAQLNVENIFGIEYFATAHNNNNISPGAPRSAYVTVTASF